MPGLIDDIIEDAKKHGDECRQKAHLHFLMSEDAAKKYRTLGFFATLFSSVVGTTIFAALSKGSQNSGGTQIQWIQIATGFMSITAAVLAALQTFLLFNQTATDNKVAASAFDKCRLGFELFLLKYPPSTADRVQPLADLEQLLQDLGKAKDSAPSIPDSVFRKANIQKPSAVLASVVPVVK